MGRAFSRSTGLDGLGTLRCSMPLRARCERPSPPDGSKGSPGIRRIAGSRWPRAPATSICTTGGAEKQTCSAGTRMKRTRRCSVPTGISCSPAGRSRKSSAGICARANGPSRLDCAANRFSSRLTDRVARSSQEPACCCSRSSVRCRSASWRATLVAAFGTAQFRRMAGGWRWVAGRGWACGI